MFVGNGSVFVYDYCFLILVLDLKVWVGDDLMVVWDCIVSIDLVKLCVFVLVKEGGKYRFLLRVLDEVVKGVNGKVDSGFMFVYMVLGEVFRKVVDILVVEGDFEFVK